MSKETKEVQPTQFVIVETYGGTTAQWLLADDELDHWVPRQDIARALKFDNKDHALSLAAAVRKRCGRTHTTIDVRPAYATKG